jgi:hypothetical protein
MPPPDATIDELLAAAKALAAQGDLARAAKIAARAARRADEARSPAQRSAKRLAQRIQGDLFDEGEPSQKTDEAR